MSSAQVVSFKTVNELIQDSLPRAFNALGQSAVSQQLSRRMPEITDLTTAAAAGLAIRIAGKIWRHAIDRSKPPSQLELEAIDEIVATADTLLVAVAKAANLGRVDPEGTIHIDPADLNLSEDDPFESIRAATEVLEVLSSERSSRPGPPVGLEPMSQQVQL